MSHHGMNTEGFDLGATGQFPQGRLNNADEGELKLAIGEENGKVIIDFGKPVKWIGFTPEQALEIANNLKTRSQLILLARKIKP